MRALCVRRCRDDRRDAVMAVKLVIRQLPLTLCMRAAGWNFIYAHKRSISGHKISICGKRNCM